MAIKSVKGHGLKFGRDTTPDEPNFGTRECGWSVRQRTREQVRKAYRQHLLSAREPYVFDAVGESKSEVLN